MHDGDSSGYAGVTLLATVKSNKTSYKIKNLKKNTFYEYKVVAYRKVNGKKVAIGKSLELHAVTASKSYKYSNPTSIKVKQKNKVVSSISVKVKKTAQLKSSPVMPKGKKLKGHTAKIRYISSKSSIASVNQKGKITGKKKGTCYVYAVVNAIKTDLLNEKNRIVSTCKPIHNNKEQSNYLDHSLLITSMIIIESVKLFL